MRHTLVNESVETLSEITLAVLGEEEVEIDDDERFAQHLERELHQIRLKRAEATAEAEDCERRSRRARAALGLIEEQCDEQETEIKEFLVKLRTRRLTIAQEKQEAARACERAGYPYVRPELLAVAEVTA